MDPTLLVGGVRLNPACHPPIMGSRKPLLTDPQQGSEFSVMSDTSESALSADNIFVLPIPFTLPHRTPNASAALQKYKQNFATQTTPNPTSTHPRPTSRDGLLDPAG
ncbi:hypothetical protein PILCRDRAFT_9771 [Piloderma croceum F 1598]|uniref:Uncharacterized protein n=1 Tax=Piloderma croceum (strain F 1598) TaxID=765440 RepID=A0A0C3B1Y9_PILCF|nr:hypothetical protein PILCRDRAFT_9771 [Piloderma croceum F 1598]